MEVRIPRLSGFCPGVKAAEHRIFEKLEKSPSDKYSVIGMMINNRKYIEYLEKNNIKTVNENSEIEKGTTLFIRTHGIDRELQKQLSANYTLIDLTCLNVKRVQKTIEEHSEKGAVIIITGKKSHPEVIGLKSYGKYTIIFENEDELEAFLQGPLLDNKKFSPDDYTEIFITSQTTGSHTLFESTIRKIKQKWPSAPVESFNSICPVTGKKEIEALELQKEVDVSFVIGDPMSSNASKLYKRLKDTGRLTFFIQDASELGLVDIELNQFKTALVVSSASTPRFVEAEVVNFLESV